MSSGKLGMINGSESDETFLWGSCSLTHSKAHVEKKLVPWKISLGMPNFLAKPVVHGYHALDTRQSGAYS